MVQVGCCDIIGLGQRFIKYACESPQQLVDQNTESKKSSVLESPTGSGLQEYTCLPGPPDVTEEPPPDYHFTAHNKPGDDTNGGYILIDISDDFFN